VHLLKGLLLASGGALLIANASLCATGQTVAATPVNAPLNVGSANVCPGTQTTPAPCSQTVTMTFEFTAGGAIAAPSVLTQGAPNLDFTDAGTGTCKANHPYNTGDTCTINVTFKPRAVGARYGAAELLDTSGNLVAMGYLQGTGVGPVVTFADSSTGVYVPSGQSNVVSGFASPMGVAVDASGNFYVTDYDNTVNEILAVNGVIPESPTIRKLGSGFSMPYGVAVDGAGNVFVSDMGNAAIKEILAINGSIPETPTIRTLFAGYPFGLPKGLALDGNGNIFVANYTYENGGVYEIEAAGGYTTVKALAYLTCPTGVAVDGSGNVFVSG